MEVAELLEDEGEELLDVSPFGGLGGLGDGLVVVGVEAGEVGRMEAGRYGEGGYGAAGGAWMGSAWCSSMPSMDSSQSANGGSSRRRSCVMM